MRSSSGHHSFSHPRSCSCSPATRSPRRSPTHPGVRNGPRSLRVIPGLQVPQERLELPACPANPANPEFPLHRKRQPGSRGSHPRYSHWLCARLWCSTPPTTAASPAMRRDSGSSRAESPSSRRGLKPRLIWPLTDDWDLALAFPPSPSATNVSVAFKNPAGGEL